MGIQRNSWNCRAALETLPLEAQILLPGSLFGVKEKQRNEQRHQKTLGKVPLGSRAPNWDSRDAPGSLQGPEILGKAPSNLDPEPQNGTFGMFPEVLRSPWKIFPELGYRAPKWDTWDAPRSHWKSSIELGSRAAGWDIWDVPGSLQEPGAVGKASLSLDPELQTQHLGFSWGFTGSPRQSFPELGSGAPNQDQWDVPGSPQEPDPFGKAPPDLAPEPQNLGTLLESALEIISAKENSGKSWKAVAGI